MAHAVQWYLETWAPCHTPWKFSIQVSACPRQTKPGALLRALPRAEREHTQTGAGTCSILRRRTNAPPIRRRRYRCPRRPLRFSARTNKEIPLGKSCAGDVNRGFSTFSTEADKEPAAI